METPDGHAWADARTFCHDLANRLSDVQAILDEHIADNDELLPYVFMGDVLRYLLNDGPHRIEVVEALDEALGSRCKDVEDLIAIQIVEYLTVAELERMTRGADAKNLVAEWNRQQEC